MVNKSNVNIGDVVPTGCTRKLVKYQKVASIYYGIVIGFTYNGNPRVYPIYYSRIVPKIDFATIKQHSIIMPGIISIDKELLFAQGGEYKKTYYNILNSIENEQDKNKGVQPRKEKKIDFSSTFSANF